MIIILEGPDNTGKTTLARQLVSDSWSCYLHGIKVGDEAAQIRYHQNMIDIIKMNQGPGELNVIVDRHWMSHVVYSDLDLIKELQYAELFHGQLKKMKAVYVFCLSDTGEADYKNNVDEDHPYDLTAYKQYCVKYRTMYQAFSNMYDKTVLYDYATDGKRMIEFCSELFLKYEES